VTTRRVIVEPRAAQTPAESPQQIGRHATFIEKPILPHVAQRLPASPLAPRGCHIRAPLFVGVDRFF
jgi:hypothetical protein